MSALRPAVEAGPERTRCGGADRGRRPRLAREASTGAVAWIVGVAWRVRRGGQHPAAAARRGIAEEVGVVVRLTGLLGLDMDPRLDEVVEVVTFCGEVDGEFESDSGEVSKLGGSRRTNYHTLQISLRDTQSGSETGCACGPAKLQPGLDSIRQPRRPEADSDRPSSPPGSGKGGESAHRQVYDEIVTRAWLLRITTRGPRGVSWRWRSSSTGDSAAPNAPDILPSSSADSSSRRSAKMITTSAPSGPATSAGMRNVGFLHTHVALAHRDARDVDRSGHGRHHLLRTDRVQGDRLGGGGAVDEHEHGTARRFSGEAGGHADTGSDLVPLLGGVEAAVEVRHRSSAERRVIAGNAGHGSCTSMPMALPATSCAAAASARRARPSPAGWRSSRRSANMMMP